jgi:hypothetical protein
MRQIRTSGSTSGEWKRGTVRTVGHRQTKGPETVMPHLNYRATPRLYLTEPIFAPAGFRWWGEGDFRPREGVKGGSMQCEGIEVGSGSGEVVITFGGGS